MVKKGVLYQLIGLEIPFSWPQLHTETDCRDASRRFTLEFKEPNNKCSTVFIGVIKQRIPGGGPTL